MGLRGKINANISRFEGRRKLKSGSIILFFIFYFFQTKKTEIRIYYSFNGIKAHRFFFLFLFLLYMSYIFNNTKH